MTVHILAPIAYTVGAALSAIVLAPSLGIVLLVATALTTGAWRER